MDGKAENTIFPRSIPSFRGQFLLSRVSFFFPGSVSTSSHQMTPPHLCVYKLHQSLCHEVAPPISHLLLLHDLVDVFLGGGRKGEVGTEFPPAPEENTSPHFPHLSDEQLEFLHNKQRPTGSPIVTEEAQLLQWDVIDDAHLRQCVEGVWGGSQSWQPGCVGGSQSEDSQGVGGGVKQGSQGVCVGESIRGQPGCVGGSQGVGGEPGCRWIIRGEEK